MSHTGEQIELLSDLLDRAMPERDAMSIVELDGYVAGLIVCPESVPASDWLPQVWGGDGASGDAGEAARAVEAVMDHYRRVARILDRDPQAYSPLFGFDPQDGVLLWEPWIHGFQRAMRLRPDAWAAIAESGDEEAAASVNMILAMHEIDQGASELADETIDEIDRTASDLIPAFVHALSFWKKSRQFDDEMGMGGAGDGFDPGARPFPGRRAGRGEPCPCGSGRTYERCCGAN